MGCFTSFKKKKRFCICISLKFFPVSDINECQQWPDICPNGGCENLDMGYRCVCNPGYQVDSTGIKCLGKHLQIFNHSFMLVKSVVISASYFCILIKLYE